MGTSGTPNLILEAARIWHDAGCSVIPILANGTKKPLANWKDYQSVRADRAKIDTWYASRTSDTQFGIGLICGTVSGNLELLELEGRATSGETLDAIGAAADAAGIGWLWTRMLQDGYAEWSPSGGLHFLYRLPGATVPGNMKVAQRPATAEELTEKEREILTQKPDKVFPRVLAETRGEGGYVVVAPSGGKVHRSGDSWSVAAGSIGVIHEIEWEDRCLLLKIVHDVLDEMPEPEPQRVAPVTRPIPSGTGERPGDAYNRQATWEEILIPHGWQVHSRNGAETLWTRPGKEIRDGHSASTGYAGDADRLFVWSSSTEFTTEVPYTKFAAYALLEHRNDFAAAARALSLAGYGTRISSGAGVYRAAPVDAGGVLDRGQALVPVTTGTVATPAPAPDTAGGTIATRQPLILTPRKLAMFDNDLFRRYDWDERGWTQLLAETMRPVLRYNISAGEWMHYADGTWTIDKSLRAEAAASYLQDRAKNYAASVADSDPDMGGALVKIAAKLGKNSHTTSFARAARAEEIIHVSSEDFDSDDNAHLIACTNGVLDLNTRQLQPHSPEHMLTQKLGCAYDPNADGTRWREFIEQVLPDAETRGFLQRAMGYTMTGAADQRVMFVVHGETGSGKTATLEAIRYALGTFSAVADEATLLPRKDESAPADKLHKLRGKRFVKISETTQGNSLNEQLIKSITGMDTQCTRPLYGQLEEWEVKFTIWLATNHLPHISASDNAVWRRIKPIHFPNTFVDDNGNPLRREDAGLGKKLGTQHASAILNWLLEGLDEYNRIGLAQPESVGKAVESYRDEVDSTRVFMREAAEEGRIAVGDGFECGSMDLYRSYVAWCGDNHAKAVSNRAFTQRMEASGWRKVKRTQAAMWQGVKLSGFLGAAQQPAQRGFRDYR